MSIKNNMRNTPNNRIKKLERIQKGFSREYSKPKFSRFQKTLISAGIVGVSLITAGVLVWNNFPPKNKALQISGLEQKIDVFFEQARSDEDLRQQYINQKAAYFISALEIKYNTKLVHQIIYDPELRRLDELCNERLERYKDDPVKANYLRVQYFRNSMLANQENRDSKESKHLGLTTLPTAAFAQGEASDIYLPKECFDPKLVASEDEFLSILDHELYHALVNNKGIPIRHDIGQRHGLDPLSVNNIDPDLGKSCGEVAAYHYQLSLIENETRNVRQVFRQRLINSYDKQYNAVKSFADRTDGSINSRFAKAVLECLVYRSGPKKSAKKKRIS